MRQRKHNLDLPKCVYEKKGALYYVKDNKWLKVGNVGEEIDQSKIERLFPKPDSEHDLKAHIKNRLSQQKQDSKNKGRSFDLTLSQVLEIGRAQKWRCALTDIPFSLRSSEGTRIKQYAPSIDRIDNSIGYEASNVRLVLASVNIARNVLDDDLLVFLAQRISSERRKSFRQKPKVLGKN